MDNETYRLRLRINMHVNMFPLACWVLITHTCTVAIWLYCFPPQDGELLGTVASERKT